MKGRTSVDRRMLALTVGLATAILLLAVILGTGGPGFVVSPWLLVVSIAILLGTMSWIVWRLSSRLRSAETRVRRLGGDAAHELRTPVASARASLEASLRQARAGASDREAVRGALHDVQRLWVVVEGLLLMTRDADEPALLDSSPVSLLDLLAETLAIIAPAARARDVTFEEEVDGEATLQGDGDRLRLLLYKLLDNAVRFSPSPGIVAVTLIGRDGTILLRVEDEGPGIPEEQLPILFDYSLYIRDALPDRSAGSGLGLSMARWIAEAHGGSIHAANREGGGSRFEVRLPQFRAQPPE